MTFEEACAEAVKYYRFVSFQMNNAKSQKYRGELLHRATASVMSPLCFALVIKLNCTKKIKHWSNAELQAEILWLELACCGGKYWIFQLVRPQCSDTQDIIPVWIAGQKQPFLDFWPVCTCGCYGRVPEETKLKNPESTLKALEVNFSKFILRDMFLGESSRNTTLSVILKTICSLVYMFLDFLVRYHSASKVTQSSVSCK